MSFYTVYTLMDRPDVMTYLDDLFAKYPVAMSVPQIAEVLGRPASTIYKWLNDGTIPGSKVRGSWVVWRDEVKELVASGRNLPAEDDPT